MIAIEMTLLIQYKELVTLVVHILIALAIAYVFLKQGYAMGRNSIDKPVVAVPKKETPPPPYHDDSLSIYDQALMGDTEDRIDTV